MADQRTKAAVESFTLENLQTLQEECSGVLFKNKSPARANYSGESPPSLFVLSGAANNHFV
jgi:hypothetical protein